MLKGTFNARGKDLEQIVDRLEEYLVVLRATKFKECLSDTAYVGFYLEEGDD
jgi:hypothetical protein